MRHSQAGERCPGRRGSAWLARHRGFPSLQPRRVPACGTRRAPERPESPSLPQRAPACRGGTGGVWRKGLTSPVPAAPSKKQGAVSCPLGRAAEGNLSKGNWISQPCLKGAEGCSVPVKWFMCGTPWNFSTHPLLAEKSNKFCLNPGTGMWMWVSLFLGFAYLQSPNTKHHNNRALCPAELCGTRLAML